MDMDVEGESVTSFVGTPRAALSLPDERFGLPCVLSEVKLPTKMDILRRTFLAYEDKFVDDNKSESLETFMPTITLEIVAIWKKISIPINILYSKPC